MQVRKKCEKQAPETLAAQGLGWIDGQTGAVVSAIQPATTFLRDPDNQYRRGSKYARADNPTFVQPEALLTALEGGGDAMLFASGMAAATACFMALRPGDHVVAPKVMYWSLRNWLLGYAREWGLAVDLVAMDDIDALAAAVQPGRTKLVWVETPANPLWTITDIAAAANIAHGAGAKLAVDSTVATPVFCRPFTLGADIIMHSASKYLNGHSDVIAGALVTRENDEYWQCLQDLRIRTGAILGTFEAFLLMRGMRTLYPRVRAAAANAQAIAEALEGNPHISEVRYPGLRDFPDHTLATRQMQGGFGAMLSIRVKGGEAAAIATAAHVEIWKRATSLGGVESLIEHRGSVEGENSPCPMDLLRLSTGIEVSADLIGDLEQALAKAAEGLS
jgi:cystathionine gamma-synthase